LLLTGSLLNFTAAMITHALVTQLLAGALQLLAGITLVCQSVTYKCILKTNDDCSGELRLTRSIVVGAVMAAEGSAMDWAQPYTNGQLRGTIFAW
jgi:hypothetical protein